MDDGHRVAAAGPEDLSATLAEDRGLFGHGPCEGASPEDLLDSWHGHSVEVICASSSLYSILVNFNGARFSR